MQLNNAKKLFLDYLRNDRQRSLKTLENYERAVDLFVSFCNSGSAQKLDNKLVEDFGVYVRSLKVIPSSGSVSVMKPQTINLYLVAARSFLTYMDTKNLSTVSPSLLKLEPLPIAVPQTISSEDVEKLLAAPSKKTLVGARNSLILRLLIQGGFLVSEICAINRRDVNFVDGVIVVSESSKLSREVPLKSTLLKSLKKYLKTRTDKNPALFIQYGKNTQNTKDLRLSIRTVQRLVKGCSVKAGLSDVVTPQVLRNTFASHLVGSGVGYDVARAVLGHVKIESTKKFSQSGKTHPVNFEQSAIV